MSDFIDDGAEDEKVTKQKLRDNKGHQDDSDQDLKIVTSDQVSSDDEDPYDDLPASTNKDHGEFRYCEKNEQFHLKSGFCLPRSLFLDLFPHQMTGVQWLLDLFKRRKGGVLGDDMGLGKTV